MTAHERLQRGARHLSPAEAEALAEAMDEMRNPRSLSQLGQVMSEAVTRWRRFLGGIR